MYIYRLLFLLKTNGKSYLNKGTCDFVSLSCACANSPVWHTLKRFSTTKELVCSSEPCGSLRLGFCFCPAQQTYTSAEAAWALCVRVTAHMSCIHV